MSAVRLCARSLLRRKWAGTLAVAMLVGVAGVAVLTAIAGARRSESAAPRLYRYGNVADVEVNALASFRAIPLTKVLRIPSVRDASAADFFALGTAGRTGPPTVPDTYLAASADGGWTRRIDRIGVLPSFRGRLPDPNHAEEVIATVPLARQHHLHLGQTIPFAVGRFDPSTQTVTSWTPIRLRVVAIAKTPNETITNGPTADAFFFGTRAFARRFAPLSLGNTLYVILRNPAHDLLAFEAAARRAYSGDTVQFKASSRELTAFSRIERPYTDALFIFAAVAAVAGSLVVAQALSRMVRSDAADGAALRAMGMTAHERAALTATRAAISVLCGSVLAVALAVLASPIFPSGQVRAVEPTPGILLDAWVLGAGAVVMVTVFGAVVYGAARWSTRPAVLATEDEPARPSWIAARLARAGAPMSIVNGSRLAFQSDRGLARGSVATSMFGIIAAIATTAAAVVFGANLDLLTGPRHYGWTWDGLVSISADNTASGTQGALPVLAHSRLVSGVTTGSTGSVVLDGRATPAYGLQRVRGRALPVATSGRMPARAAEIALGARTLHALHRSVGDTVVATSSPGTRSRLRIVGVTLLPSLNTDEPSFAADEGIVVTRQTLGRLNPDVMISDDGTSDNVNFALVDLAPHTNLAAVRHQLGKAFTVAGATAPGDIASYSHVQATPLLLAGLLGMLGAGVLAHLLLTSTRSRRRELAVLKTLGCTRRQIGAIVLWQSCALVAVALAAGGAIGVASGRWAWGGFAANLGLADVAVIPITALVVVAMASLGLGLAIAALPARLAARTQPARVLRAE